MQQDLELGEDKGGEAGCLYSERKYMLLEKEKNLFLCLWNISPLNIIYWASFGGLLTETV